VGLVKDHGQPAGALALRRPLEPPRAAGAAVAAASILGRIRGTQLVPVPRDQQLATGMAPGAAGWKLR
jgi:hypothetical protein